MDPSGKNFNMGSKSILYAFLHLANIQKLLFTKKPKKLFRCSFINRLFCMIKNESEFLYLDLSSFTWLSLLSFCSIGIFLPLQCCAKIANLLSVVLTFGTFSSFPLSRLFSSRFALLQFWNVEFGRLDLTMISLVQTTLQDHK